MGPHRDTEVKPGGYLHPYKHVYSGGVRDRAKELECRFDEEVQGSILSTTCFFFKLCWEYYSPPIKIKVGLK